MKIACTVIWYNPIESVGEAECIKNILTYSIFFKSVYIIDNSQSDNAFLAKKIDNAIYIPNMKNKGIAAALNQGCEKALDDNFDWIMTMDQDSSWDSVNLTNYLSYVESAFNENNKIVSFAANANLKPTAKVEIIKQKIKQIIKKALKIKNKLPPIHQCERVLTSANIINLTAWKNVGKFNEWLFIDEVDHEFCYRLRDAGYLIIINDNIVFKHNLGDDKKTFFYKINNHSDFRLFYIMRNNLFIQKYYPNYSKLFEYKKNLRKLIIQECIFSIKFINHWKIYKNAKKSLKDYN